MNNLRQASRVEVLKARRSRVALLTALGFLLAPLAGGFFMLVLKDPELAQQPGVISARAQKMQQSPGRERKSAPHAVQR